MKWRMADVIDQFTPWCSIAGRKAVSLEEYDLLAPLGRSDALPETLVLESAVAFGRWLVMASSDFTESAVLDSVAAWHVHKTAGRGDVLQVTVTAHPPMSEPVQLATASGMWEPVQLATASGKWEPVQLATASGKWEPVQLATASPLQNRDLKSLPRSGMHECTSGNADTGGTPMPRSSAVCAHVADAAGAAIADGRLVLLRVPLAELVDPEAMRLMWLELNRS